MEYQSTRDKKCVASPQEAVLRGLAPDGGLYVARPDAGFDWQAVLGLDTLGMAERILSSLLPGFQDMGALVRRAYPAGRF